MVEETKQAMAETTGALPDAAPDDLITGAQKADDVANINLAGFKDVAGVPEGKELPDDSPQVHSLTVLYQPNNTTMISARFWALANGWVNKQKPIAGKLTVQQISTAISDLAAW